MLPVALQSSSAHSVPTGQIWQPPLPSHLPFVLHVDCGIAVHMPRGSTVPAAIGMQWPAIEPTAQLRQAPVQAWSQQTPCAQNVLRHSTPFEQEAPSSLRPHELLMQVLGDTHWLSLVHALKQRALPLQV